MKEQHQGGGTEIFQGTGKAVPTVVGLSPGTQLTSPFTAFAPRCWGGWREQTETPRGCLRGSNDSNDSNLPLAVLPCHISPGAKCVCYQGAGCRCCLGSRCPVQSPSQHLLEVAHPSNPPAHWPTGLSKEGLNSSL